MSRGGGKSGRTVTPHEAELWERFTRSADKVKLKPRVTPSGVAPPAPELCEPARKAPQAPAPLPARPPGPPPPAAAKAARTAAPLAEFARRTARQVASGKLAIDARLDLHGMRQADAHARLYAFLRACQAKGARTVLVITGKGGEASPGDDHLAGALGEPQRGVLRRSVPRWLEAPELRAVVLSYTRAGTRHGGDGALYVQLRKAGPGD
jgi:DNA-nicking Smr family endonuclease